MDSLLSHIILKIWVQEAARAGNRASEGASDILQVCVVKAFVLNAAGAAPFQLTFNKALFLCCGLLCCVD